MITRSQLAEALVSAALQRQFTVLYGSDPDQLAAQKSRWLHLADLFADQFPEHMDVRLFSTPGRTEVGGNHTDHQHGRVLCASVDLDIIALAAPNQDHVIRLKSEGFPQMDVIDLTQLEVVDAEKEHSASLIRGIAAAYQKRGYKIGGFDAYTSSHVPKGSGLSSSAAFEVLVATMMDQIWSGGIVSPLEKAMVGQFAENHYFGKPSGLMDQCGCSVGGFIGIDFKTPGQPIVTPIQLDFGQSGYCLIITNTGGSHADLTDEYASIPRDMKQVAALLGHDVLRDVSPDIFWQKIPELRGKVSDQALLRAIHFFQDDNRVSLQTAALQAGDIDQFLALVQASGNSSRSQLQNVYAARYFQEQPLSIALSLSEHVLAGRGACRVHGGGFAGTIQAFVPMDLADAYLAVMRGLFGAGAPWMMRIRSVGSTELTV